MGIKDFYNFIKEHAPNDLNTYHLSQFTGYRFAIDISIFLNKYIKSAGDKNNVWLNQFIMLLCTLKKHSIKAVCVFDGPNPPIEKQVEQQRRREEGKKAINRMNRCIEIRNDLIENYLPDDIELSSDLIIECKKLYGKPTKNIRVIVWTDPSDAIDALKSVIDRLEISSTPITNDHRELAKKVVDMMGIPYFQADGEAEALCAYLAIHKYVDCVLTEDTDVLAYGAPWLLAFKDYKLSDEIVYGIHLQSLLDTVGYTLEEFRDLCILLECDYNNRIKGFPPDGRNRKKPVCIGLKHAVQMIDEYRNLETIEDHVDDIEPLIYQRCREIFTTPPLEELKRLIRVEPLNSTPKFDQLEKFFRLNKLTITIDYIEKCWTPGEIIFEEGVIDHSEFNSELEEDYDSNFIEDENYIEKEIVNTITTKSNNNNTFRYIRLSVECRSSLDNEGSNIDVCVCFENDSSFNEHESINFDMLIEPINAYLESKKNLKYFYVDGVMDIIMDYGNEKPKGDILKITHEI